MLNENIKACRKAKGLSQEELAVRINVVRQTISKWEKGLSVPDSIMLSKLAEELDVTVSELLGEEKKIEEPDALKQISERLEQFNIYFTRKQRRGRVVMRVFGIISLIIAFVMIVTLVPMALYSFSSADGEVSVIGGADGPTNIEVTSSYSPIMISPGILAAVLFAAGLIAMGIVFICKSR